MISLRQHLIAHLSFFEKVEDEADLKAALKFMPDKVAARLRDRELADVMAVLLRRTWRHWRHPHREAAAPETAGDQGPLRTLWRFGIP